MKLELIAPEIGQLSPQMPSPHLIVQDIYFKLGLDYAAGRNVPRDLIAAHKFFNLSCLKGNKEAALHRKEVSEEMSKDEIALALVSARDYLKAENMV
jgi:uncharacterized protein